MLSSELPQELHFINFVLKMGKYLMCKRTTPKPTHGKEISEKGKPNLQFEDLPANLWSLDNSLKFSCLKHIQLFAHILSHGSDKILYLAYVMRAAPFVEKVEVHFASGHSLWFAQEGPLRHELGHDEYKYLKNLCVTGFKGARGQLEFLLHVVENATALDVITVDTTERMLESDIKNEYLCSIAR
ncbi:uncharacterized protein LOC127771057 isoform X2 [Oryza glaberrima]|uniref:uncharacterized protein LOC127771057 isoform X2 n=1 Tax=Oryza glaberrima TaxID=4538 RepID=UPI00224C157C|nr:uncharacterized protein LOC127771057 isoform X2 [Oryza glaberrima]XP_052152826.1 uncharacterized protein LOC127771057 isoform X2 [Oryza glaberrima]